MPLQRQDQIRYWSIAAAILVLALWLLGNVLLPFVLGGAIAYFMDPVADRLEAWGLSRAMATALITIAAIVIFVILALAVIPTLLKQLFELIEIMPQVFRDLWAFFSERFPSLLDENSSIRLALIDIGEALKSKGGAVLKGVLGSAKSLVNILILLLITPVVAVYMLLDWDRMIARVDQLLPRDHAPVVRQLAREVDDTLAAFIRGMGTVSLILGTYYAVALMAVGLQFGLVVGFIAGVVTFIPYLGALIGGSLAIGLALFQFWGEWGSIGLVTLIFVIGQVVEGNFLTPKLVGDSIGLHPVWLLLALSVFGALFGFVGMLVAVPLAAALGVVIRFGVSQYTESRLFQGESRTKDE